MDTIRSTQRKLKADFTEQISKLKREVTVEQESSSQEVVKKLNKLTYHFQRKGNEAQYLFNSLVEDHLESTKKELAKQTPENDMQTATVKKSTHYGASGERYAGSLEESNRKPERWGVPCLPQNNQALLQM